MPVMSEPSTLMNTATNAAAKKPTALVTAALALFGITDAAKIPAILYALGLRESCGRCGGSGRYSYCQMYGDKCFGCSGHGMKAAKLTKITLAAARAKVEAGDLAALRAAYAAKIAAKKQIAPVVAAAREVYLTIGNAYTAASMANATREETHAFVESPLFRAQDLNNALFYGNGISSIESDVKSGRRRDYAAALAEIEALAALLATLRAEWLAFVAAA